MAKRAIPSAKSAAKAREYYSWETIPDYTRKSRIYPAVCFYPKTLRERSGKSFSDLKTSKGNKETWIVRVLVEGPMWDCTPLATNLAVNQKLKSFLEERFPDDLEFLLLDFATKQGRPLDLEDTYYGVIFKHRIKAYVDFKTINWNVVHKANHGATIIHAKDACWNSRLIDAEIAEAMIEAGFTGLGFKNLTGKAIPGTRKSKTRIYPEEAKTRTIKKQPTAQLEEVIADARSFKTGWKAVLKVASEVYPKLNIKPLEALDIEADLKLQKKWLNALLTRATPKPAIKAFWFGLFDAIRQDKSVGPEFYACGNNKFYEDKPYDFGWAVKPTWFPEGRYTRSKILDHLFALSKKSKPSDAYHYFLTLGYAALLVAFGMRGLSKDTLKLLGPNSRPIAVGFDSGDAIYAGSISSLGWSSEIT